MQGIGIIDLKGYYDNENEILVDLRLIETPIEEYFTVDYKSKKNGHKSQRFKLYEEALEVFNATVSELILRSNEEEEPTVPISDLELSVRAYNALMRAGYRTLNDLINSSALKLRRVRNLGTKTIKEIIDVVKEHGYELSVD